MGQGFDTTDWTLVRTARADDERQARAALARLCAAYWYPLYAFVRHEGYSGEDAADLVQGYFAALLEKGYLSDADPTLGRFRTFLLTSLKHFLSNERDKERALKRGGGYRMFSMDSEEADRQWALEPPEEMTPEDVFERRWARTVMDRVLTRLRSERVAVGKGEEFEHLEQFLTGEEPHTPYREIAETLGGSEVALRVTVHRLRSQFAEILRHEIRQTVVDAGDVDDEIRHLLEVLEVPHSALGS